MALVVVVCGAWNFTSPTTSTVALPPLPQAKPGDYYENPNLGFKLKMPADWDFVPGTPNDPNTIGSYRAPSGKGVLTKKGRTWPLEAWLLKFEQVATKEDDGSDGKPQVRGSKDLITWLQTGATGIRGWNKPVETKEQVINDIQAVEYVFKHTEDETELAIYACVYKLKPDLEVALVLNGPGEDKKWSKYESPARTMAKSFKILAEAAGANAVVGGSYRDQKRAELQKDMAANPGWTLYESPNYFIVSNVDDKPFINELMERLEAIRKIYEELYPASMAQEMRALAAAARKKEEDANPDKKPEPKPDEDARTVSGPAGPVDPAELSKASVVRVCQNQQQYSQYGGPSGSAGYWYFVDEELVLYDDKASGGRGDTWAVVNHEAFHQYIFYFFGNISPHSWYNEGNGDFFSGYEYKNKKSHLKKFDWRDQLAKTLIREDKYVPLKDLVHFTQAEYYGNNKHGAGGGENYAQGWSFIYFLRTGEKNAKGWNPAWNGILDTYLRTLVETEDLDKAVDKAFAGVDWDQMEKCWADYTLKT